MLPSIFHYLKQFNINVSLVDHPAIQQETDELLPKDTTESSTCGAGFYSNVFMVPKHRGGLQPIPSLKQFNHCMYIPTFNMPIIRQV